MILLKKPIFQSYRNFIIHDFIFVTPGKKAFPIIELIRIIFFQINRAFYFNNNGPI